MGDWPTRSIADLVDIAHGFAFKGEHFRDSDTGNLLLTPGNFRIGGGFQLGKPKYYEGPIPSGYVLEPGELLVTMTDLSKEADTLGYPAIVPECTGLQMLHNQRLGLVCIKDANVVDKRFLYYVLCSPDYRAEVLASATGTTVHHSSPTRIGAFEFPLPPLQEQRQIAGVLGVLDDKIGANHSLNETLELLFQAIFRSWFMDFDPVIAKSERQRPAHLTDDVARLFPDRLEDSPIGPIPEGWQVGCVGDIASNPRRKADPKSLAPSTPYMGLEHLPRRSVVLDSWGEASAVTSAKWGFESGEVLFGKLRPYFHKVGVALCDGICSTDILVVAPKEERDFGVLLGTLSSPEFVDHADGTAGGTRQPRTSWRDMARYRIPMPPDALRERFTDLVRRTEGYFRAHAAQAGTLTALRDSLIQRLLSGELQVRQAEQLVEEAI